MSEQGNGAAALDILHGPDPARVLTGDCIDVLRALPPACLDALVTDPPAGIGFMGRDWDKDRGGRDRWIEWLSERTREARRVLKPGAHGLVWALPRTSHWTAMSLELAGFEIRDVVVHIFATGFPKSLNLGDGRGTALKPASEHWILVRAPVEGTTTANVERWGTGGLEIDACRVGTDNRLVRPAIQRFDNAVLGTGLGAGTQVEPGGRWPANVVYSHTEWCVSVGRRTIRGSNNPGKDHGSSLRLFNEGTRSAQPRQPRQFTDAHGLEEVESWECVEGCPVLALDEQSGERKSAGNKKATTSVGSIFGKQTAYTSYENGATYRDTGGASRFFFCAKPSPGERDYGLDGFETRTPAELTGSKEGAARLASPRTGAGRSSGRKNHHPTVKSISLMRYLCRLVTPPGGIVLDPFAGSGTTGCAAALEGLRFLGIEQEPDYAAIARARIAAAQRAPMATAPRTRRRKV